MKKGYLKLHLTLAINRLKMTQAKKASLRQTARRGISELLAAGKEESARIRVSPSYHIMCTWKKGHGSTDAISVSD